VAADGTTPDALALPLGDALDDAAADALPTVAVAPALRDACQLLEALDPGDALAAARAAV
jgi:hypothetical protein